MIQTQVEQKRTCYLVNSIWHYLRVVCTHPTKKPYDKLTRPARLEWSAKTNIDAKDAREFAQAILMACDKADELNGEKSND